MDSRLADVGVRVIVPLCALVVIVLALPATPSGAHAIDLVTASALLATGCIALVAGRRWQGMFAMLSAAALATVASADPVGSNASVRVLLIVGGPLIVPFAAGAMGGRGAWWWTALIGGTVAGPLRALF